MSDETPVLNPSDDKKPWESKTLVLNAVLGILVSISPLLPFAKVASDWINSHGVLIGMVFTGLGIALRLITKGAIVLRD